MGTDILISPMYVQGKTRDDLVKAMLANNLKYQAKFHYFDISKDGKGWVAWYNHDFNRHPLGMIDVKIKIKEGNQ